MLGHYILKDGKPVLVEDVLEWARWFEGIDARKERHVADETIGNVRISTIFLGLDHSFGREGAPVLWEQWSSEARSIKRWTAIRHSKTLRQGMRRWSLAFAPPLQPW